MLLVNKCKVRTIDDVGFNIKLIENSIALVKQTSIFPNLLITGVKGCGKKTLAELLIQAMYGNVPRVTEQYVVATQTYNVHQSPYHIELNCAIDKTALLQIVKQHVKVRSMHDDTPYRVIVLHNAHYLLANTQASLRCIMEQYHRTCRFIAITHAPNRLIDPLRSRCVTIHVPAPIPEMLYFHLCQLAPDADQSTIAKAVEKCNGNVRLACWMVDGYKESKVAGNWELILHEPVKKIRETIYRMFSCTTSDYGDIVEQIVGAIVTSDKLSWLKKQRVLNAACEFDLRLINTKRPIIHVEAFALFVAKELSLV